MLRIIAFSKVAEEVGEIIEQSQSKCDNRNIECGGEILLAQLIATVFERAT